MNIEEKYNKLIFWFKEISKIPRNSCKEEKIANFICNFAKERGLEYKKDKLNNVIVKKQATLGFENKESIIFQAHTDMVCEKTKESMHNFEKDGIEILEDKETLTANGTTLGADDGIGVATLLLLLDDNEITHPNIYCLFTVQEEIGMDGARYFDYSGITAKYLINVDGEEENTAIVGCAGGVRLEYQKEFNLEEAKDSSYEIKISGLRGGHSGVDIDKNRINSNYLMALILNKLENVKINCFIGGNKDNAIANYSEAIFSTTSKNIKEIIDNIKNNLNISESDKNLKIEVFKTANNKKSAFDFIKVINIIDSKNLINLIINLKQGVIEYSKDIKGLVETSGNIGIVNIANGKAIIAEMIRSSDDNRKEFIKDINNSLAEEYGYLCNESSSYPGWKYTPNTKLEQSYIEVYNETHRGEDPIICAIHAGVECGMIYKKMPHLEMISIGPDIVDVHTVNETLYLGSCKRFLQTLILLIEKL